jgi:AcrR family transcriptional regulator
MAHIPTDKRREHFIQAATKIIREEGLAKATTRRIAQVAGAPLGSLHYCFRNKEELFEAVSQNYGDEGLAVAANSVVPAMGVAKATGEILRALSNWIIENQDSQIGEFEFYSWAMRSKQNQDMPRRVYGKWIGTLRDILQSAASGQDDDLDLDAVARAVVALADGFNLQDRLLGEARMVENMEVMVKSLIIAIDHGGFRRSREPG